MGEVTESDWKLFKELLPKWQESYMEMLIGQYIEILNGGSEASSRFWALEERINRDKLSSGVLVNDIRRSTMRYEIATCFPITLSRSTTLTVSPKTLRAAHDVASVGKNAERHAHPQPLYCINRPAGCIFRLGGCFLPTGAPGGGVQIPEYSASRSPRAREWVHKTALKALIMSPRHLKDRSFLQYAAHGACFSPKIQYAGTHGC